MAARVRTAQSHDQMLQTQGLDRALALACCFEGGSYIAVLLKLSGSTIVRSRRMTKYECRPRLKPNDDERT